MTMIELQHESGDPNPRPECDHCCFPFRPGDLCPVRVAAALAEANTKAIDATAKAEVLQARLSRAQEIGRELASAANEHIEAVSYASQMYHDSTLWSAEPSGNRIAKAEDRIWTAAAQLEKK